MKDVSFVFAFGAINSLLVNQVAIKVATIIQIRAYLLFNLLAKITLHKINFKNLSQITFPLV